jgi:hypothetical protein
MKAAGIFHTEIPVKSQAELDRAFTDTVTRMLRNANDRRLREADLSDMNVFAGYIENKKKLEQLEGGKLLHLGWNSGSEDRFTINQSLRRQE